MLELQTLRNNVAVAKERLALRHFPQPELIDQALELDEQRKKAQSTLDTILAESNSIAKEIGMLMKQGKTAEADILKQRTTTLKQQEQEEKAAMDKVEANLRKIMLQLPNLPHASVPAGKSAEDNIVRKQVGNIPQLHAAAKPHWELMSQYNLVSMELGVQLTGAGFPVFLGKGARLQRALASFFLERAVQAGYLEVVPPFMVNEQSAYGTGQLPDKEGQMYFVTEDNLYLIPTAEVPITNIYRDHIFNESDLPVKMAGHSPCFRREAGTYGKDVRGLNRVHQFEKVEIVQFAHPDQSYQTLEEMLAHVETLLEALELPYRILHLCGGDMGFASALTYDFEVFSAAQQRWLEVSSVSNFETFQSNRLKARLRDAQSKKTRLVHTLNGSALALPRIMAALLENHQTPEGIRIPAALQPYTGFDWIR